LARQKEPVPKMRSFPVRPFAAGVLLVCLALGASAVYSYVTLTRLRAEFLDSRGQDLISVVDARTRGRGPGGRTDTAVWQTALEETLAAQQELVAFIEIIGSRREVVARAGENDPDVYLFDRPLPTPRRGGQRGSQTPPVWRLRAGLYPSSTDFITRAAGLQLAVAAVAIAGMIMTATYLLRTVQRFVGLQQRELQARRLADLGKMAATLAHEIRNPLGAVKGLTQVAKEQIPVDHDVQAHLQTVVDEAQRLERLVDDLLRFARPRKLEVSRFDLVATTRQVGAALASGPTPGDIEVSVDPSPVDRSGDVSLWIRSDADGVRQVLLNVLLNALQASEGGARVRVALRAVRGGKVEIVVDDDGPGLPGGDPEELFSPFSTTKTRGSGLGLAVSRQIVEQLGGTIALQDGPEGGARCIIVLPEEIDG
jgi:signal transduction histidine kinase